MTSPIKSISETCNLTNNLNKTKTGNKGKIISGVGVFKSMVTLWVAEANAKARVCDILTWHQCKTAKVMSWATIHMNSYTINKDARSTVLTTNKLLKTWTWLLKLIITSQYTTKTRIIRKTLAIETLKRIFVTNRRLHRSHSIFKSSSSHQVTPKIKDTLKKTKLLISGSQAEVEVAAICNSTITVDNRTAMDPSSTNLKEASIDDNPIILQIPHLEILTMLRRFTLSKAIKRPLLRNRCRFIQTIKRNIKWATTSPNELTIRAIQMMSIKDDGIIEAGLETDGDDILISDAKFNRKFMMAQAKIDKTSFRSNTRVNTY